MVADSREAIGVPEGVGSRVASRNRQFRTRRLPRVAAARSNDASPWVRVGGRELHWVAFCRSRKDDGAHLGYSFEIELTELPAGPVTLDCGCHFGLDRFIPADGVELR